MPSADCSPGYAIRKRLLFNAFAGYLLRYENEVSLVVDGEPVNPTEFIERSDSEDIAESEDIPQAVLRHLVLGRAVDQEYPNLLRFATHGTTISSKPIEAEPIPGYKYLGLVDSPYLDQADEHIQVRVSSSGCSLPCFGERVPHESSPIHPEATSEQSTLILRGG